MARIKLPDKPSGFLVAPRQSTHSEECGSCPRQCHIPRRENPGDRLQKCQCRVPLLAPGNQTAGVCLYAYARGPRTSFRWGRSILADLCTSDSKTIYVANAAANVVSAIDVKTMKEVARIPVGKQPDHVETLVLP